MNVDDAAPFQSTGGGDVETQEWRHRLRIALNSARSVQIEQPGAVSVEHTEFVEAYVMGEIDAKEAYERTVARHRRMPRVDYPQMCAEADEHFGTADRVGDDDPWERDRG